jgi:3-hydroxyacyl-[acyl-carrier-protein] dehydratase
MFSYIFDLLPYKSSFRFVEEISFLDVNGVVGHYTLREDAFFYEDHFPGHPVTPGAILTEIMAQIGLVVLGIHLIAGPAAGAVAPPPDHSAAANATAGSAESAAPATADGAKVFPLLSSVQVDFHKMALPGQRLTVTSKKDYFRFDKLKCHVEMHDAAGELIAKGVFSGFIKKTATA